MVQLLHRHSCDENYTPFAQMFCLVKFNVSVADIEFVESTKHHIIHKYVV